MNVYFRIKESINKVRYPHVFRWHKHIQSICVELDIKRERFVSKPEEKKKVEKREEPKPKKEKSKKTPKEEKACPPPIKKPISNNMYAVLLQIIPKDEETSMKDLENAVRATTLDGLKWGNSQLIHLAYGLKKLSIICTVEDDKVSIQDVIQKLGKYEQYIKSVDIAAFNKL